MQLTSHVLWRGTNVALALGIAVTGAVARGDDERLIADARARFGIVEPHDAARVKAPDAVLGRALFWDQRVSGDGKTACASCHLPRDHGADRRPFSLDAKGKMTKRNSQTVFNTTLQPSLRWTGNRKSAAEQAEKSVTGSMGLASPEAAVELLKNLGYEAAFQRAFPQDDQPVSVANYGLAIESYERTLTTPAPFDRFLSGDAKALETQQKQGLKTFLEIGCANCHSGPVLGGQAMEKFGVVKEYWTATRSKQVDLGRFEETGKDADRALFRVSMLRNIAQTGPYFHDGSVAELADAVRIMADVQLGEELDDEDTANIVAFLRSLTGPVPAHFAPPDRPAK